MVNEGANCFSKSQLGSHRAANVASWVLHRVPHQKPWVYLSLHEGCIGQIVPGVYIFSSQNWLGKFGSFLHGFYGRLGDAWHQLPGLTGQSGLCFNRGSTPPLTPSKPLPSWEQTTFKIKTQTLRKAKNPLVIFPIWRGEAVTWIMIN